VDSIRFREDHSLWAGTGLRFQARFAHLGYRLDKPVGIYLVERRAAPKQIAYDAAMFNYAVPPGRTQSAGRPRLRRLRLHFHTDWTRDVVAFQGASYFRAVSGDLPVRLSARGLRSAQANRTTRSSRSSSPTTSNGPAPESNRITLYALLDSPSVAGAYRFVIDVADTLTMDVDAALYPRVPLAHLASHPAPACSSTARTIADRPSTGAPRSTIPTGCRSRAAAANGSGVL